jgi:hypothetical protein
MSRLHPVFHVGLLAPHIPKPDGADEPHAFDAEPDLPADATGSEAPVPSELAIHQVLRHRDLRLDDHNVREYLASYREAGSSTVRWVPEDALPAAMLAQYWTELAAKQLSGRGGPPPGLPRRHQATLGHGSTGLDALGLGHSGARP